jgi:biopolymer transport protein ExbB
MHGLLPFIDDLMAAGGMVLWWIMLLSVLVWFLIIERILFIRTVYPVNREKWLRRWDDRSNKQSSASYAVRTCYISQARIQLSRNLMVIKMLIALCPLLGLLGTVTGMIETFDVLAVIGTGNARAMANGVSHSTVPTMAGMVVAISCLYFSKWIEDQVDHEVRHLSDILTFSERG